MAGCTLYCSMFTRTVSVIYMLLAVASLMEFRKLLNSHFVVRDDTLYVPLIYCEPTSITINGTLYEVNDPATAGLGDCDSKDVLVGATGLALVISIFALIVFMFVDCFARFKVGCFKKNLSLGMGFFCLFIVFEAGLSMMGLVRELMWWEGVYQQILDALVKQGEGTFGQIQAATHANSSLLGATGAMAFVVCVLIFFDGIIMLFTGNTNDDETEPTPPDSDLQLTNSNRFRNSNANRFT